MFSAAGASVSVAVSCVNAAVQTMGFLACNRCKLNNVCQVSNNKKVLWCTIHTLFGAGAELPAGAGAEVEAPFAFALGSG